MKKYLSILFLCLVLAGCQPAIAEPAPAPTLMAAETSSAATPPPAITAPPAPTAAAASTGSGAASPAAGATAEPTPATLPAPATTAAAAPTGAAANGPATLALTGSNGSVVDSTVDGNALGAAYHLAGPAANAARVVFALEGQPTALGNCAIPAGGDSCAVSIQADGWAWHQGGQRAALRTVVATVEGDPASAARASVAVAPKPVVLVHGFNSNHLAWTAWTAAGGFLDQRGMRGYAVDDGQFDTRAMDTGNVARPLANTNSIAENARILDEYVEAVRANTGADRVDMVAHSMGGLIARYYVQTFMPTLSPPGPAVLPVVNQLYMLGTPNGGTACARIAATTGILLPATAQITPEYVNGIFNPTVHDRRNVPFFAVAGNAVQGGIAIRCTGLPTDMIVSVASVLKGIPVGPGEITAVHTDLNSGTDTFELVFPSLARPPEEYPIRVAEETVPELTSPDLVQSTVVKGGTLQAGQTQTVTLTIDEAREASFMLYAPGSVVSMTIRTVSGALLTEETPQTNPNVTFQRLLGEASPVSLGYGVLNPRAGAWQIGLTARSTPPGGGPFALVASLDTSLVFTAEVQPAVVRTGGAVTLRSQLRWQSQPRQMRVWGQIRDERNQVAVAEIELFDDGQHADGAAGDGIFAATWQPTQPGEYQVILAASGDDAEGNPFERLSVLAVRAE